MNKVVVIILMLIFISIGVLLSWGNLLSPCYCYPDYDNYKPKCDNFCHTLRDECYYIKIVDEHGNCNGLMCYTTLRLQCRSESNYMDICVRKICYEYCTPAK